MSNFQIALKAALAAGNHSFSNNTSSVNENLLDSNIALAGKQVKYGQLNNPSHNTVSSEVKHFSDDMRNDSGGEIKDDELKQNIVNSLTNIVGLPPSGPWAAQPDDIFFGLSSNANIRHNVTGHQGYQTTNAMQSCFPVGDNVKFHGSNIGSSFPIVQQQQLVSKISSGWNDISSNWCSQNTISSNNGSVNTSSTSNILNTWSQALQYQRLGLSHTPMNAFSNMSNFVKPTTSFGSSAACSSLTSGTSHNAVISNSLFSGLSGLQSHDRMKGSSQMPSSIAASTQSSYNGQSSFKMDAQVSQNGNNFSTSDTIDWNSIGNMFPTSCASDLINNGIKDQPSPLDSLRCLENPLLEMMKNGGTGATGIAELCSAGLLNENILATTGPSAPGLGHTPSLPVDLFGVACEERFSRKVFVGGLPPDIDEGKQ